MTTEIVPAAPPEAPPVAPVETPPEPVVASWRDGFDPDVKDHPSISTFENPEALAKSHIEQGKLVGKKGLIVPDENSTPEQVAEFHQALGVPETVEGYELGGFQPPEILAEAWDANGITKIAEIAKAEGVSSKALTAMVEGLAAHQAETLGAKLQGVVENRESVRTALNEEWGLATPAKMDLAKRGFAAAADAAGLSTDDLAEQLLPDGGLIGDNAALTKIFSAIGEGSFEMALQGGKGGRMTMTTGEAKAELNELNASEAINERSHPEHKIAVARKEALNKMAYPEEEEK